MSDLPRFERFSSPQATPSKEGRFREHDRVMLKLDVADDDGRRVPSDAQGTIISVGEPGLSYLVEFTRPFGTIIVLRHDQICATRS